MNWIQPYKRLAIYLRDDMACTWCGIVGAQLTLDHLTPRAAGGSNHARNLVSACIACNARRGKKPWAEVFPKSRSIVRKQLRKRIDTHRARRLLATNGGFKAAIKSCCLLRYQRSTLIRLLELRLQAQTKES